MIYIPLNNDNDNNVIINISLYNDNNNDIINISFIMKILVI